MSSFRTENPALADMDRHLDQEAEADQLQQDIEARARKMLTDPRELARLLELRDEEGLIRPVAAVLVEMFAFHKAYESFPAAMVADPIPALLALHNATQAFMGCIEGTQEALLEDALEPRANHKGKSLAEELLDADRWDDGDPGTEH